MSNIFKIIVDPLQMAIASTPSPMILVMFRTVSIFQISVYAEGPLIICVLGTFKMMETWDTRIYLSVFEGYFLQVSSNFFVRLLFFHPLHLPDSLTRSCTSLDLDGVSMSQLLEQLPSDLVFGIPISAWAVKSFDLIAHVSERDFSDTGDDVVYITTDIRFNIFAVLSDPIWLSYRSSSSCNCFEK